MGSAVASVPRWLVDDQGVRMPDGGGQDESETSGTDQSERGTPLTKATRPAGSSWQLVAIGVVAVVAIVAVGFALAARSSSTRNGQTAATTQATGPASPCGPGVWPKIYEGEPSNLAAATDTGFYVWFDAKGWHVRALATSGQHDFKVTITTSSPITDAKQIKQVPADAGSLLIAGNTVTLSFSGDTSAKGLDFSPCASAVTRFRVDLGTPNLPWPVQQVWVGPSSKAVANPLAIERS